MAENLPQNDPNVLDVTLKNSQPKQAPQVKKKIPVCPMMTVGADNVKMCLQENCAWYMTTTKTCAVFVIAHNNVLDIKSKQGK